MMSLTRILIKQRNEIGLKGLCVCVCVCVCVCTCSCVPACVRACVCLLGGWEGGGGWGINLCTSQNPKDLTTVGIGTTR